MIERLLAERFAGGHKPAVTFVETAPLRKGALVAMDAIAATASTGNPARPERHVVQGLAKQARNGAHVAVQPPGPFAVVSGLAARGEFEAGIAGTMEQLRAALESVGLSFDHVVQIKSFVGDISRADQLRDIVAGHFKGTAPPQVVTEWLGAGPPAEIELIAAMPGPSPAATAVEPRLTYVEPILSRYSRVAVVRGGRPVFISGLYGPIIRCGDAGDRDVRAASRAAGSGRQQPDPPREGDVLCVRYGRRRTHQCHPPDPLRSEAPAGRVQDQGARNGPPR